MKLYVIICCSLLLVVSPMYVWCQQAQLVITGVVTDREGIPLHSATVSLMNSKTGETMANSVTDQKGSFKITASNRDVIVTIKHIGYVTFKALFPAQLPLQVKLVDAPRQLTEVVVKSQKDFIEHQFDRFLVNVGGDSKIGMNALDVFQKIPGVSINGNDIMFEGKQITVTIDGRSTRLSGADLLALLNNTPTTGVAQVEVLFSPSAKFDANGNGGIINIKRLVRDRPGYDLNAGVRMGHGWKYLTDNSIDGAINLRKGSNYWSANYSFGIGKRYQEIQTNTLLIANAQRLMDSARYVSPGNSQNLRFSWDHYFQKKNIFGVLLTAYDNERTSEATAETGIYELSGKGLIEDRLSESNNLRGSRGININANLKLILDTLAGKELSMDFDAGAFGVEGVNKLDIYNLSPLHFPSLVQQIKQESKSPSTIYSYKMDFLQKLYHGIFEAGLKGSYISIDNSLVSLNQNSGEVVANQGSNDFDYQERVYAGYLSTRQVFSKLSMQVGLRIEQTNTRGNSVTLDSLVQRNYLNFFPNLSLGYKLGISAISASYSRRLERPTYNYLNPFDIFSSAYSSSRGNPYLKPSFSDNYRLGFSPSKRWSLSLSYSLVKDVITDLSLLDDQTSITTSIKTNMNRNNRTGFNLSFSKEFFKLWSVNYSGGISLSKYQFNYNAASVTVSQISAYASLDNRITLPKSWWLGLFFYGQSKATYGNRINQPYYMINLSAGKKLLKGKANVVLNCNDVFFTSITRSSASYGNVRYNMKSTYDSRNIKLGFNYTLSSGKVETRKRSSGSAEEQQRNQS